MHLDGEAECDHLYMIVMQKDCTKLSQGIVVMDLITIGIAVLVAHCAKSIYKILTACKKVDSSDMT